MSFVSKDRKKLYELLDKLNVSIIEANSEKQKAMLNNDVNVHIFARGVEQALLSVRKWLIEEFDLEQG